MEANELRTGVLVYRKRNQWTLERQKEEVVLWDESIWYRIGECTDYLECYSGIPLTEEWLIRFGFKRDVHNQFFYDKGGLSIKRNIYSDKETDYTLCGNVKHINFKYVHQLQNLYFALTSEELILKSK